MRPLLSRADIFIARVKKRNASRAGRAYRRRISISYLSAFFSAHRVEQNNPLKCLLLCQRTKSLDNTMKDTHSTRLHRMQLCAGARSKNVSCTRELVDKLGYPYYRERNAGIAFKITLPRFFSLFLFNTRQEILFRESGGNANALSRRKAAQIINSTPKKKIYKSILRGILLCMALKRILVKPKEKYSRYRILQIGEMYQSIERSFMLLIPLIVVSMLRSTSQFPNFPDCSQLNLSLIHPPVALALALAR